MTYVTMYNVYKYIMMLSCMFGCSLSNSSACNGRTVISKIHKTNFVTFGLMMLWFKFTDWTQFGGKKFNLKRPTDCILVVQLPPLKYLVQTFSETEISQLNLEVLCVCVIVFPMGIQYWICKTLVNNYTGKVHPLTE